MSTADGLNALDLGFSYGRNAVLENLSLAFPPSTLTGVTGPSGSGKSTLLYVLGLMVRPTAGGVWFDGQRLDNVNDAERAARRARLFGFVFQDAVLDPARTALDNVLETSLYRGVTRRQEAARARELLTRFGVADCAGRRPGQLSGGQAQRVALCRALLGDPPVLLADEPTGNLDDASGEVVLDALRSHAQAGGVAVVVTHDRSVAQGCDRQIRIGS